jgi:hypothetical protein
VSAKATELIHHVQLSAQENACEEIREQYPSNVGVHHLARTPYTASTALPNKTF